MENKKRFGLDSITVEDVNELFEDNNVRTHFTLKRAKIMAALIYIDGINKKDDQGRFFVENSYLCSVANIAEKNLIKALRAFEKNGYITREVGTTERQASKYFINYPKLEEGDEITTYDSEKVSSESKKEKKEHTKEEYKEWLAKTAKKNRNNPNNSEQAFIDILNYFHIKYNFEIPIVYESKKGYIFDFYINIDGNNYDIEIDGITHMNEDAKLRDEERDAFAKSHNIKVIRLNSYFVLYLRNVFKKEFTKESFLEWIINECPINFKNDISEPKEKERKDNDDLDSMFQFDKNACLKDSGDGLAEKIFKEYKAKHRPK